MAPLRTGPEATKMSTVMLSVVSDSTMTAFCSTPPGSQAEASERKFYCIFRKLLQRPHSRLLQNTEYRRTPPEGPAHNSSGADLADAHGLGDVGAELRLEARLLLALGLFAWRRRSTDQRVPRRADRSRCIAPGGAMYPEHRAVSIVNHKPNDLWTNHHRPSATGWATHRNCAWLER
jgi:hypothetical protein